MAIENLHFQFQLEANRGDYTRSKKRCLKLNALTAARLPWCPSSLRQESRSTVARALRNARLGSQNLPICISVLTRSKRGHDGETAGKEERRKNPPAFSNSLSAQETRMKCEIQSTSEEVLKTEQLAPSWKKKDHLPTQSAHVCS
jgi:hypothetical protein